VTHLRRYNKFQHELQIRALLTRSLDPVSSTRLKSRSEKLVNIAPNKMHYLPCPPTLTCPRYYTEIKHTFVTEFAMRMLTSKSDSLVTETSDPKVVFVASFVGL
jgi:hypothetical protein